jgi:hypothetical protein
MEGTPEQNVECRISWKLFNIRGKICDFRIVYNEERYVIYNS